MHFTIQKTLFANALARAAAIAGTRCTMPILACVKLVVDDFGCRIIATDLEISFETYIERQSAPARSDCVPRLVSPVVTFNGGNDK